jgi:hypothetical protein
MRSQDSGNPRRADDYIDRSGETGRTPMVLGLAFVAVLAFLIFGAPKSANQPSATAQGEFPSTTPGVPSIPVPSPPKPQ